MEAIIKLFLFFVFIIVFYYLTIKYIIKAYHVAKESSKTDTDYFVTSNKKSKMRKFLIVYIIFMFCFVYIVMNLNQEIVRNSIIMNIMSFLFGFLLFLIGIVNIKHTYLRISKNGMFPFITSLIALIFSIILIGAAFFIKPVHMI